MAHGTVRAAATAVLGLVALQAVSSRGGSGRIAELLADANGVLERFLDPAVPAIPDLRNGETWGGGQPGPQRYVQNAFEPTSAWPSYNVPAPGSWPSLNVPAPTPSTGRRSYDRRLFV